MGRCRCDKGTYTIFDPTWGNCGISLSVFSRVPPINHLPLGQTAPQSGFSSRRRWVRLYEPTPSCAKLGYRGARSTRKGTRGAKVPPLSAHPPARRLSIRRLKLPGQCLPTYQCLLLNLAFVGAALVAFFARIPCGGYVWG